MVIVLNPRAGGGRAWQKWNRIQALVRRHLGKCMLITLNGTSDLHNCLDRLLQEGQTQFVAAGGDGTVNLLINGLLQAADADLLRKLKIGALGLGSSNDFHKSFERCARISDLPCKIDFQSAALRDVGVLKYEDSTGGLQNRYWLLNASLGITAQANYYFNNPSRELRFLKRKSAGCAILWAALRTIMSYRNLEAKISIDGQAPIFVPVTNLGIVKNPHFSGSLCYDSPWEPDSGNFHVHLCEEMSVWRTLLTFANLARRKFTGLPHTRSWRSATVAIHAQQPFAVEYDGEVIMTRSAAFSLMPQALQVCTC